MNELVVLAEGQTEQTFVRDLLASHLALQGTTAWAVLSGKQRKQGGVRPWEAARVDIVHLLRQGRSRSRYCSTMFDYYAMPDDWPGRVTSRSLPWDERASHVEQEVHKEVVKAMGSRFDGRFFLPYIQLHEFEALAFADVESLSSVIQPLSDRTQMQLVSHFSEILEQAGHPEAINDSYDTCPSRRITGMVRAYRKRTHGPIVTNRIGLDVLRQHCDHFAEWVDRLEAIGR